MNLYEINQRAGSDNASSVFHLINKLQIVSITVAGLIFFLLFSSGCSYTEDSSCVSTTVSSVYSDAPSDASEITMQWRPRPLNGFHPAIINLYKDEIPNSIYCDVDETASGEGTSIICYNISVPTLTVFLPPPDKNTGAAVIYCPGGGYVCEGYGSGIYLSEKFNKQGIAFFILKYRLPSDSIMADKSIGPLQDAQQAIKTVRERSDEWRIDPSKIGVMGASAGGHLASTLGTHFEKSYIPNEEKTDLRPDFMILVSSVISMYEDITHQGSRNRLLGEDPEEDIVKWFSNETQITEYTPPTWLIHAEDDSTVLVENSILFYDALVKNQIPAELNLYDKGDHSILWHLPADEWMQNLLDWMSEVGIITSE